MLFAVIALLMAAFTVWQQAVLRRDLAQVRAGQTAQTGLTARLRDEVDRLNEQSQSNSRRIDELGNLTPRISELRDALDAIRERTDAAERSWVKAEARHLLEIANRSISLEHDVQLALTALELADQRLQSLRDPALNGVRRALAQEIQSLRSTAAPDIAGIAVRLASAEEIAARLPVLGAIAEHYQPDEPVPVSTPGFARAWSILRNSFFGMVRVRRIGADTVELVSLEEQGVRRHHLQLLLFAARLAALRGDEAEYRASLNRANGWLGEMFDSRDIGVTSLQQELDALGRLAVVTPLPDISQSLKLLDKVAPRSTGGA
jgi:uroporphyrin-3 C-methyltransferase